MLMQAACNSLQSPSSCGHLLECVQRFFTASSPVPSIIPFLSRIQCRCLFIVGFARYEHSRPLSTMMLIALLLNIFRQVSEAITIAPLAGGTVGFIFRVEKSCRMLLSSIKWRISTSISRSPEVMNEKIQSMDLPRSTRIVLRVRQRH